MNVIGLLELPQWVSCETVRFGEEYATGVEANPEGVANNSLDMNETQEEENLSGE